jgi:hypothetical protein
LQRGGEWPWTVATRPRDVLWARIVSTCSQHLTRPSVRDLADALGTGKSTVQRVIEEHDDEWRAMFDE